MSNRSKHIAEKKYYYSGKTFGSASSHNIHQNKQFRNNESICNINACIFQGLSLG